MMPSGHGGYREGAGRKPVLDGGGIKRTFVLRPDQIAWLTLRSRNRELNKSEYLRQILDEAMRNALI